MTPDSGPMIVDGRRSAEDAALVAGGIRWYVKWRTNAAGLRAQSPGRFFSRVFTFEQTHRAGAYQDPYVDRATWMPAGPRY